MDRNLPALDRNPFLPLERQSTFGLTTGVLATVLLCTLVAIGALAVQLDAFASTPTTKLASAQFDADMPMEEATECREHHALRFAPVPAPDAPDAPVTDLKLVSAELTVTCEAEEPHAVMSADCVADLIGCLIVLASGGEPVTELPAEAVGAPMHPDSRPYGGVDPDTLSMIECIDSEGRV